LSHIPARRQPLPSGLSEPLEPLDGEGPRRPVSWRAVVQKRWIILACTVAVVAITVVLTRRMVPVYEGGSTLRIELKEANLPEAFRTLSSQGRLPTEMEELRSRALAADVVAELGLRLGLIEPQARHRSDLLRDVRVADSAQAAAYRLTPRPEGGFALVDDSTGQQRAVFAQGQRVAFGGFSFVPAPAARQQPSIRFAIETSTEAAVEVAGKVSVSQPSRDVNFVKVSYRSRDQELAWRVPQALVAHYIAQRQELQTMELRSTIDFLRQQITTISSQLAESERRFESYRERFEVINPEAEATSQVGRLVSMQTQRGLLDNERTALAALLADVDAKAVSHTPGDPSQYRRLLAFPTLLQSQAGTGLLQSLTTAEDQYKALLARRTPQDSDVQALASRIRELERELRAMAATYLQGLTNQVQSLDGGLQDFRRQLRGIPEKELQYARLERQPKVLEGVYTMLQTRLKEAEVAVAARDPSVRVVDAAVPPIRPVWPKPVLNAFAALMCGLLLGLAAAFGQEYMDRAIRTRMDVRGSTGLPVIGLIPRIHRKGSPVALIAEQRRMPVAQGPQTPAPRSQLPSENAYTFLGSDGSDASAAPAEPRGAYVASGQPPMERVALTISTKAAVIAEAFGMLQTNIAFSPQDAAAKTLVFTSPLPGDGKTTTVVNLGLSLAQRGIRVLLIDADVRRGVLHSVFRGAREPGLSEVLRGTARFERARRGVTVGERGVLDYLTTGKLYPGDYGLVASDAMRDLLARVREEYDLVIVDTPPVNIITDAAVLAANADGVVIVARVGVTEASALSYAVEQLRHVRAAVLGVVLNDIDLQRDAAYDRTYKDFRAYEYSTSNH
jgi:capsular exopolysaccharide synthesis family protein